MPEIVATRLRRPVTACSGTGIQEFQSLGPDPFLPRARGLRRGAPAIRAAGRPLSQSPAPRVRSCCSAAVGSARPQASSVAAARRAIIAAVSFDLAKHLGIDLNSVRTAEDCLQVLSTILTAIGGGEIAPAEGARIAGSGRDLIST